MVSIFLAHKIEVQSKLDQIQEMMTLLKIANAAQSTIGDHNQVKNSNQSKDSHLQVWEVQPNTKAKKQLLDSWELCT